MDKPIPNYPYFSCSRIQTFRKCPKAFAFSYIDELPEAFETIEKHLGSAVHEAFEWIYQERLCGREPSGEEIEARYREVWAGYDISSARIVKKEMSAEDYFRKGLEMVKGYTLGVIRRDDSLTLHLEHQFDLDLQEGIVYRGIIDRVCRKKDGTLRLVDYKTGRSVPDPRTDLQLRSYCLSMFAAYPDEQVEICYEDLREHRGLVLTVLRRQSDEIRSELLKAISEITAAESFPAQTSSLCAWCGHQERCEEGKKLLDHEAFAAEHNLCPRCGGELRQRSGKFGAFLSCGNFPTCRFSRNL